MKVSYLHWSIQEFDEVSSEQTALQSTPNIQLGGSVSPLLSTLLFSTSWLSPDDVQRVLNFLLEQASVVWITEL